MRFTGPRSVVARTTWVTALSENEQDALNETLCRGEVPLHDTYARRDRDLQLNVYAASSLVPPECPIIGAAHSIGADHDSSVKREHCKSEPPGASVVDLVKTLSHGVILCELADS